MNKARLYPGILIAIAFLLLALPVFGATDQHGEAGADQSAALDQMGQEGAHHGPDLGALLPLWSAAPFVGILLSIALFPLFAPHFWHRHFPKVSALWALIFAIPFLIAYRGAAFHEILHIYLKDYIPFILLLWALFTVSGGILVGGSLSGTPRLNLLLLGIGTVIASWTGTTGASMLLIRPVLRANAWRKKQVHVIVFFIFLVSNIGGSLTPLGDPPLFLGFLHGVPFFWTFHLVPHMGFAVLLLLGLFYLIDRYYYRREARGEEAGDAGGHRPGGGSVAQSVEGRVTVRGLYNLIFLAGIVGAVLMSGMWRAGEVNVLGVHVQVQDILRDLLMVVMGVLSLVFTPKSLREENGFTWFPIKEVAYLFAGIFMTIIPALAILRAGTEGQLAFLINAVREPAHYFWVTGALSSFLDNAPTYLTFFNLALGNFFSHLPEKEAVVALLADQVVYLKAISAGAVFMGANTYIGNAPNFMVRSIAEENGVPMPSFFGYLIRYSLPILIPIFVVVSWLFF